jgi:alpha-tubulin suppressor-like RCC1 family protein
LFRDVSVPTKVDLQGKKMTSVSCGSHFSLAVSESGELFSWGSSSKGALGHEDCLDEESPRVINFFRGKFKVVQIACGEAHVVAVTQSGPYSWGWNACGQLGLGHNNDSNTPQQIEALKGMEILNISCGTAHSAAVVCKVLVFPFEVYFV